MNVQFTDESSGGNIKSWHWYFGDGDSSNEQNPEHIYSDGGVYTVSLTIYPLVPGDPLTEVKFDYIHVDIGTCDTVRIDTLFVERPLPLQITVPVYAFADDTLGGFSLGFVYDSDRLTVSSVNINADAFPPGESNLVYSNLFPDDRKVQVGGADFTFVDSPWGNWTPAENIFSLVFDIDSNTPDTVISIDSSFIPPGGTWQFNARIDSGSQQVRISPLYIKGVIVIGNNAVIDLDGSALPEEYTLEQNVPNPFNPNTYIDFALPRPAETRLEVFNILGQKVKTLVDQHLTAGHKRVDWDGVHDNGYPVSSGIYLYRLTTGDFTATKKMVLIK